MPVPVEMLETGIYGIRNKVNGKMYVGQTGDSFESRWRSHKQALVAGYSNAHLQRAWDKYGYENFEFFILERCPADIEILTVCEQKWMDHYDVTNRELGYNICPTARTTLGYRHTEETKARIAEAGVGREFTEEEKNRRSVSAKKQWSEMKEEMGKRISEAQKASEAMRKPKSEEHKAKIAAAHVGMKLSEETIRKRQESRERNKRAQPHAVEGVPLE